MHVAILLDQTAGLHQCGHVVRDFAGAASRQERNDRLARVQSIGRGKLRARSLRRHISHQRMADEISLHAARAVPFLFKRKNAQTAHESSPHQIRTPRPPGPELRAHEIDVLHAPALQRARQAQMKSREIGEDRESRFAPRRFAQQAFPHAFQGGILLGDFDDSDQGNFGAVGYEFDAGIAHARPAHAEELNVGARAQCLPRAAPRTCRRTLRRRR